MNRFSVDLDAVDPRTYLSLKVCLQNAVFTVSKLAVIGTQTPYVLLVGAVVGIFFLIAMVGFGEPNCSVRLVCVYPEFGHLDVTRVIVRATLRCNSCNTLLNSFRSLKL